MKRLKAVVKVQVDSDNVTSEAVEDQTDDKTISDSSTPLDDQENIEEEAGQEKENEEPTEEQEESTNKEENLDQLADEKVDTIEESKETPIVSDTNLDVSEVVDILKMTKTLSQSSEKEKAIIEETFHVNYNTLLDIEEKGYSLLESINLAMFMNDYELSFEEAEIIKEKYPELRKANTVLNTFIVFKSQYILSDDQEKEIKKLLLKGYSMQQIKPAFMIGTVINADVEDLIDKNQDIITLREQSFDELDSTEVNNLERVVKKYPVNEDELVKRIIDQEKSLGEIEDAVDKLEITMRRPSSKLSQGEKILDTTKTNIVSDGIDSNQEEDINSVKSENKITDLEVDQEEAEFEARRNSRELINSSKHNTEEALEISAANTEAKEENQMVAEASNSISELATNETDIATSSEPETSLSTNSEAITNTSLLATSSTTSPADTSSIYTKYLNAPFSIEQNGNESINLSVGSLRYDKNLINIPGRNGKDLNLGIYYDSTNSNLYESDFDLEISYDVCYWYTIPMAYLSMETFNDIYDEPNWNTAVRYSDLDEDAYFSDLYTVTDIVSSSSDIESSIDLEPCISEAENDADDYLDEQLLAWDYHGSLDPQDYLYHRWGATDYLIMDYLTTRYDCDPIDIDMDINNDLNTQTFLEKRYGIGAGWSFNFPSIEKNIVSQYDDESIKIDGYLHMADGTIHKMWVKKYDDGDFRSSRIQNYKLKDMEIDGDDSFYNGAEYSYYVLMLKDGTRIYFNTAGRYLGEEDRYGNTIKVQYNANHYPRKIIDTLGRETTFIYTTTSNGQEVTITSPDNSVITLRLESETQINDGDYLLTEIEDQEGRVTQFDYLVRPGDFNFEDKDLSSAGEETNYFATLRTITYPTFVETNYNFEPETGNLGEDGLFRYFRLEDRNEQEYGIYYNQKTYEYSDDNYTGCPTYDDPDNLPSTFLYQTMVTDSNNTTTEYFFDEDNLLFRKFVNWENETEASIKESYYYDDNDLLEEQKTSYYDTNEDGNSDNRVYIQYWLYDSDPDNEVDGDQCGDLLEYSDSMGRLIEYTNEPIFHQITSKTEKLNDDTQIVTEYDIDPDTGNVESITKTHTENGVSNNIVTSCIYDNYGNLLKATTINGDKTYVEENDYSSTYNRGYLTKKTLKLIDNATNNILDQKITAQNTYNFNNGRIITSKDGLNYETSYVYDDLGRIISLINPDNTSVSVLYDDITNIVTLTDENNHKRRNIYDGFGRLKSSMEYKNNAWVTTSEINYNTLGLVEWTKDAYQNQTQYQYDIFNRVTTTTDSNLKQYTKTYYDAENLVVDQDPEGNISKKYYDDKGRLIQEQLIPDNSTTSNIYFQYDYLDNLTKMTDGNGNETNYAYDDQGRLVTVTNELNETTTYNYDKLGNLIQIIYPDTNSIQKEYNVLGQVLSQTDPLGLSEYNTYDAAGKLQTHTDKNQVQTIYNYNNRNRLLSQTANGQNISFTYDGVGNINTMVDSNGTIDYDYYEDNRLQKVTLQDNKMIQYEYNSNGSRTKIIDPFNLNIVYAYDNLNRLDSVTADGKTYDYEYYDNGMLKTINYPTLSNGQILRAEYTYDDANRLKTVLNKIGTQILSSFSYNYDSNGNITTIIDTVQNTSNGYLYDGLNRLDTITRPDTSQISFGYDNRGNRNFISDNALDFTDYTPENFAYNVWDQLQSFTTNSGTTYNYTYTPDCLRSRKIMGGNITRYFYDNAGRVIAEADGTGNVNTQKIWGEKTLARKEGNSYYYYIYNGHGDVVEVVK